VKKLLTIDGLQPLMGPADPHPQMPRCKSSVAFSPIPLTVPALSERPLAYSQSLPELPQD
jgi:hypothetical protein